MNNQLHPELQDALQSLEPTPQEFIEIWHNRSVADPYTGEIIDLFDMSIPVEHKIDAYAWVQDQIKKEQELIKERIALWKGKLEKAVIAEDKVKEAFKAQMLHENKTKVKSMESTLYIQERKKIDVSLEDIEIKRCTVEIHATMQGKHADEILAAFPFVGWSVTKKKVLASVEAELLSEGIAKEITNYSLCRR